MKKWFIRHRILLISFFIVSIILTIMVMIQINIITQPDVLQDLKKYIETNNITPSLKRYVFIFIVNLILLVVWAILFTFIIWMIFFPTKKSFRETFYIDSLEFLYKMPSNLKKELKRDE